MPLPRHLWFFAALLGAFSVPVARADTTTIPSSGPIRLMAVGDSITAGADFFSNYRYPLWEKLFSTGYIVDFTGTQTSATRIGPLAHEGYGGKNTEYLAATVPEHFRTHPADIVLLHSGHNHSVEEHPVPGIIAATEELINAFREVNPQVTVLLAQVIPAGKLPKYSYLPELNVAFAQLATRLDRPEQRVVLVDQTAGFDWATDTVSDLVHPNDRGAEKMAQRWFTALQKILPPPAHTFGPKKITYREGGGKKLQLHLFDSPIPSPSKAKRPAIIFFFGGGWTYGTPIQFYPECQHFADRGYVAISADYRIASTDHTTPFDAADDAKAAFAWVVAHAEEIGVDPTRIIVAGASAGGHLAALCGLDRTQPTRPAAMLLWYPVLDTSPQGHGNDLIGARFAELSPLHLLAAQSYAIPPTLIMVGDADQDTPEKTARAFQALIKKTGGRCEVVSFPGAGHPLYAYREGGEPLRTQTLKVADDFLATLSAFGRPVTERFQ